MSFINDRDLIGRFKNGDVSAFETLVREYQDRVYNFCRYMLRDPHNAKDATQDVFLKTYRGLKGLRPDSSLYPWIYRIAVTTCLDYRRKAHREVLRNKPLTDDLASDMPFPDQIYESRESTGFIQLALQKLPEKLRAAVVLREIEEFSYEEIAQFLHTSVGTVKSRISRAREKLRLLLKKTSR